MKYLEYFLIWLTFGIVGTMVLYVGYGFAMSAKRARDAGLSPKIVVIVDGSVSFVLVILDALLNLLFYSVVCLDFRVKGWLHFIKLFGFDFIAPELITERMRLYYVNPDEWVYRKYISSIFGKFLDAKDPKGWHISDPRKQT